MEHFILKLKYGVKKLETLFAYAGWVLIFNVLYNMHTYHIFPWQWHTDVSAYADSNFSLSDIRFIQAFGFLLVFSLCAILIHKAIVYLFSGMMGFAKIYFSRVILPFKQVLFK